MWDVGYLTGEVSIGKSVFVYDRFGALCRRSENRKDLLNDVVVGDSFQT